MADSVKGIVPPALSLDRTTRTGKEREKKKRAEAGRKPNDADPSASGDEASPKEPAGKSDQEKVKGKILDINV